MERTPATIREQVLIALRVYSERGVQAAEMLKQGDFDAFEEMMGARDAAFANFRAIDHIAIKMGVNVADIPAGQTLWRDAQAANDLITQTFGRTRDEITQKIKNLRRGAKVQSAYHSGTPEYNKFLKVV